MHYTLPPKMPCVNCGKRYKDHAEGKCLFEATEFKPSPHEVLYFSTGHKENAVMVYSEDDIKRAVQAAREVCAGQASWHEDLETFYKRVLDHAKKKAKEPTNE
jgi:hypothetical protein